MKNVAKVVGLVVCGLAVASVCCGAFKSNAKCFTIDHVVRSGQTLNGIADSYYDMNSPELVGSKDDYRLHVRVMNNDKHNLERQLQINDIVKVEIKQVRK